MEDSTNRAGVLGRRPRAGRVLWPACSRDTSANGRWSARNYATINLEVEVPLGTDVDVEDQSASVALSDPPGGLSVRDVAGDLVVSGGRRERIRYSNVRGSLDLPPARRKGRGPDALQ